MQTQKHGGLRGQCEWICNGSTPVMDDVGGCCRRSPITPPCLNREKRTSVAAFSGGRAGLLWPLRPEGLSKFTNRGGLAQPVILARRRVAKPKCFICMAFFQFL